MQLPSPTVTVPRLDALTDDPPARSQASRYLAFQLLSYLGITPTCPRFIDLNTQGVGCHYVAASSRVR